MNIEQLVKTAIESLEDMKATDIKVLDVSKLTSIADRMIICTARSSRHLEATANDLWEKVKQSGVVPLSISGSGLSGWVLVDLNSVIVHIMLPEARTFYSLEKLWSDGE